MTDFRWLSPHDWLAWKTHKLEKEDGDTDGHSTTSRMKTLLWPLVMKLDSEQIQEEFQKEMTEDGYFDPKTYEDDEFPSEVHRIVNRLNRPQVVAILEGWGFACYAWESDKLLSDTLIVNVLDGTIPPSHLDILNG